MILDRSSNFFGISKSAIVDECCGRVCYLCNQTIGVQSFVSWDHVLPRSKGGRGNLNKLPTHKKCNNDRSDSELTESQRLRSVYFRLAIIAYAISEYSERVHPLLNKSTTKKDSSF